MNTELVSFSQPGETKKNVNTSTLSKRLSGAWLVVSSFGQIVLVLVYIYFVFSFIGFDLS